ncbi:MAG: VanW family protein [candidate division WWE3 bacterium]|nr:VanW family protein [candidate division WWE3 bacterium]
MIRRFGFIFLGFLLTTPFIAYAIFNFYYAGKIIPGVYFGQTNLGGKSVAQSLDIINRTYDTASPSSALTFGDKNFPVTAADIDFTYNALKTAEMAYNVGRSGDFISELITKWQVARHLRIIKPIYSYNSEKLSKIITNVSLQLAKPAHDASFSFDSGTFTITSENSGWIISEDSVKSQLLSKWSKFDYSDITLPLIASKPQIYQADLQAINDAVSTKVTTLTKVTFNNKSWSLTPGQLLHFLTFTKSPGNVTVSANTTVITDYLTTIAADLNADSRGEVFKTDNNKVVDFKPSQPGYELKVTESAAAIAQALELTTTPKSVALVVNTTPAPKSGNEYGINELIGEGTSNFYGSIPGRIHNIDVASGRISGALIPPNTEISFNNLVGEVSAATGYDEAYIISDGRTILGTGGGLCQVSTTLFRAALNAGLPIISRTAHAYRVHYYEPPVGLDATVYNPGVDLVFRNDTPNYILIQREIDINKNFLGFQIFGTSDGRLVAMNGPVVTNNQPAPATLYQDDPTLPKGTTLQTDFSASGADVTFYRKVTRAGSVLQDDTFVSHYQPWRAIFNVGTKE